MITLLVVLLVLSSVVLTILVAAQPKRTVHAHYELRFRRDERLLRRELLLGRVLGLRRFLILIFTMVVAGLAFSVIGAWALVVCLCLLFLVIACAKVRVLEKWSHRLYDRYEQRLLDFVEKQTWTGLFVLRSDRAPSDQKLESPEHLLHLIESTNVLTSEQQAIVRGGIQWPSTTVETIMIPRSSIVSIKKSELLGPLVLDDLHKTGHSQFPVMSGSIDSVIGILDITDSLDVTTKSTSKTAEQSMSRTVVRVAATDTLPLALDLLQKSHQHILVVIDDNGKTIGLVTLADITGSLLGKTGVK